MQQLNTPPTNKHQFYLQHVLKDSIGGQKEQSRPPTPAQISAVLDFLGKLTPPVRGLKSVLLHLKHLTSEVK